MSVTSVDDAVAKADFVVLAVPYEAVERLCAALAPQLAGKTVVDTTNPMGLDGGRIVSTLPPGITAGQHTAAMLPRSTIVRAFSHVMDELLVSRGTHQAGLWGVAIAADDAAAKLLVSGLITDAGFVPVDVGALQDSAPLDPAGAVFPRLYTAADLTSLISEAA